MSIETFEGARAKDYNSFVKYGIPNYHYFLSMIPNLLGEASNKKLLSIGCGTGNELLPFLESPDTWNVTGIDPSSEMLCQAKKLLSPYPNVELIHGTITDLPINRNFGAATLLLVLHFMKDDGSKLKLLQDISSRLVDSGPIIILDITGSKRHIIENIRLFESLSQARQKIPDLAERMNRIKNKIHSISEPRLEELVFSAGFTKPIRFFQSFFLMGWIAYKR